MGRTRRPEAKKSMNKLSKTAFLTRILDKQGAKKKRKAQEISGYVQGRRTAYLRERKACPREGTTDIGEIPSARAARTGKRQKGR